MFVMVGEKEMDDWLIYMLMVMDVDNDLFNCDINVIILDLVFFRVFKDLVINSKVIKLYFCIKNSFN